MTTEDRRDWNEAMHQRGCYVNTQADLVNRASGTAIERFVDPQVLVKPW